MKRSLLLVACASLLALLPALFPAEDVLTWRVAKGTTIVRSFECNVTAELQSFSVKVDGEDQDSGPKVEMSIGQDFAYEFSDDVEDVKDGRPAKLLRSFTKISGVSTQTLKLPEQDEREEKTELTSELEGKRVRFVRDDSSWTAKWDADEDADKKLLDGLQAEVDLRAFLPDKHVSANDTWELEASAFTNFLRPAGHLSRKAKGEDPEAQNQHEISLDESLEGKCEATYAGIREENGAKVAVIELTAELNAHDSRDVASGPGGAGGAGTTKDELTYKLKGEILWDVAGGFARSASLGGTVDRIKTDQRTIETPDGDHKIEQVLTFSGEAKYKLGNEPKS